jgi:hypothetical protein
MAVAMREPVDLVPEPVSVWAEFEAHGQTCRDGCRLKNHVHAVCPVGQAHVERYLVACERDERERT